MENGELGDEFFQMVLFLLSEIASILKPKKRKFFVVMSG